MLPIIEGPDAREVSSEGDPRLMELGAPYWLRGTLPEGPRLAVVGTRAADPEALEFTRALVGTLGVAVISGGALGVDVAAHEAALDAGLPTVVVLANGVRRAYPRSHHALFERVLTHGGAIVAEVEDAPPTRGRFLRRNRLIAALADATLVVQAPARSGALSTAREAAKLARPCFAAPAAPWDLRGAGGLALLARGEATLVAEARQLARAMGWAAGAARPTRTRAAGTEDGQLLRRELSSRPRSVDELCERTGWDAARVQHTLLQLLLEGLADERDGGWVRRR